MKKLDSVKIRIYKLLGIVPFRRFIMCIESVRHRGDGLKNVNYHPRTLSSRELKRFTGFLLYNSALHALSISTALLYLLITIAYGLRLLWADITVGIATLFNIYCIMLQRYNYLRIKAVAGKRSALTERRVQENAECLGTISDEEERQLIAELVKLTQHGGTMYIDGKKAAVLDRIAILYRTAVPYKRASVQKKEIQLAQLVNNSLRRKALYSRAERGAMAIQRLLGYKECDKLGFNFTVITESAAAEQSFARLFPNDSEAEFVTVTATLQAVIEKENG